MHSFRKNCKKRKQKRRDEDAQPPDSPSHSSSIHSLPTPERHSYPQAKADALLAHLPTACRNHL